MLLKNTGVHVVKDGCGHSVVKNGCGDSGHRTLATSQEEINGIN